MSEHTIVRLIPKDVNGDLLPDKFKSQLDVVYYQLLISRLLILNLTSPPDANVEKNISKPYLKLVPINAQMSRLYVFKSKDKFFSMIYPCNIRIDKDHTLRIHLSIQRKLELDSPLLSEAITLIKELQNDKKLNFSQAILNGTYSNDAYDVVERFLTSEIIYNRFEHDPSRESGLVHPLNHFDIGVSKDGHFKLGVSKHLTAQKYINAMDLHTNCTFCNRNIVPKTISLRSWRRKKHL